MSDTPNVSEARLDVTNSATPVGEPVMPPNRPSSTTDDIRAEAVDHDGQIARAPVDMKAAAAKGSESHSAKKDGTKTAKKEAGKSSKSKK